MHGVIVQQGALFQPLVDENVVSHAQQLFDVQLLIHAGNTRRRGLVGVFKDPLFAVDVDFALVGHMNAGEDLDQCGLACAVFTDQAMDLSRLNGKLHVVQCNYARKSLRYVFQLNYVFAHLNITSISPD